MKPHLKLLESLNACSEAMDWAATHRVKNPRLVCSIFRSLRSHPVRTGAFMNTNQDPSDELMAWRLPLLLEAATRYNAGLRLAKKELPNLCMSVPKPRGTHKPSKSVAKGDIQPGVMVATGLHLGTVKGFLPAYEDPGLFLPPDHPITLMGGHHRHTVAPIARYCVVVKTRKGDCYHFPKATTIEKWLGSGDRSGTEAKPCAATGFPGDRPNRERCETLTK